MLDVIEATGGWNRIVVGDSDDGLVHITIMDVESEPYTLCGSDVAVRPSAPGTVDITCDACSNYPKPKLLEMQYLMEQENQARSYSVRRYLKALR